MRNYFHGCGFGATETPIPAAPPIVLPPVSVLQHPPIPQVAPSHPVPGVHQGVHHGVACVPIMFFEIPIP